MARQRFPTEMGVVFSRLIHKRRSIDNRYSGPEALSTVLSLRKSAPSRDGGQYDLDLTKVPGGEFRHAPDGWHAIVPLGGAIHRLYLPRLSGGAPFAVELRLDANFDIRSAGGTSILVGDRRPPSRCSPSALPRQRRQRFIFDDASPRCMVGGT